MHSLFHQAQNAGADEESLNIIRKYSKKITEAINSYYVADISKSILGTSLTAFRCDPAHIIPEYLKVFMVCEYFIKQYAAEMQQTTRKQVPITTQRKYSFIIPEIALQNRYAYFVQQSDKSKLKLQNSLAELSAIKIYI